MYDFKCLRVIWKSDTVQKGAYIVTLPWAATRPTDQLGSGFSAQLYRYVAYIHGHCSIRDAWLLCSSEAGGLLSKSRAWPHAPRICTTSCIGSTAALY